MTTPSRTSPAATASLGAEHVEVIENHVAPEHFARERPRHRAS